MLGVGGIDPFCAAVNTISIPPGEYGREEVIDGKLVFDYQLHTGPLTTRNAIRILEMYDYPRDLIAEAYEVQEKLTEKSN